jgi:predicted esterase
VRAFSDQDPEEAFMPKFTSMRALRTIALAAVVFAACRTQATGILSEEGILNLPWVGYQERLYSAVLTADESDPLVFALDALMERIAPAPAGGLAQADEDLDVNLPLVGHGGELYSAELGFTEDGRFRAILTEPFASPPGRGEPISISLLEVKDPIQIASDLGLDWLPGLGLNYSVALFKVGYRTLDPLGNLVPGSGLVAAPLDLPAAAPLLSAQHGTILARSNAPSLNPSATQADLIAYLLGASGYVVTISDYQGFGDSPGTHPFVHAKSLAWSVIDLVRAARALARSRDYPLNGQVFLAGYSEGGYATMAAQREMERHHGGEFQITASAPMAGPYDLSGTMLQTALGTAPVASPMYLPYMLLAYNGIYGFEDQPGDLFAADYAEWIPGLFDGTLDADTVNAMLPSVARDLIDPELATALEGEDYHPVRAALRENDLYRWVPASPTRLYHCEGDEEVPYANATRAYEYFEAQGAPVELVSLPFGDHDDCAIPAILSAKGWFDSLAQLP